jgi:hypothetical protein
MKKTFQTEVVEKFKTHFIFKNFFLRISCRLWDNVEKYCRGGQATADSIIRRMRFASWITKATNTHSEYAIVMLSQSCNCYANALQCYVYTFIACLVQFVTWYTVHTNSSNLKQIHAVLHFVSTSLIERDHERVMRSLFCYYAALSALQGRKIVGSIPDNVIGIFHCYNSSGRTMSLGLTQPLTEMSTRNILWG